MKKAADIPIYFLLVFLFYCVNVYAQSGVTNFNNRPHDWWQADWKNDSIPGISLDKAYSYLKGRKSKHVIVAIIDNCVDTAHEELKDYIWTNKKEIPGNGIDDDDNGYVDDVHGWCYIANNKNLVQMKEASLDVIIYQSGKKEFQNIDTSKLKGTSKIQFEMYQRSKLKIPDRLERFQQAGIVLKDSTKFIHYLDNLVSQYHAERLDKIPFSKLPFSNAYDSVANQLFAKIIKYYSTSVNNLDSSIKYIPAFLHDHFYVDIVGFYGVEKNDTNFNSRNIIGDDPDNFNDKNYGTPFINLPEIGGSHATFLAGIICANRNNNSGMKGIADNVLIMPLITGSPGGVSMTKDIVLAIHYAVDNGASIINMSMGANRMPNIIELEKAFEYARLNNVLIVTAGGNDGINLDKEQWFFGQDSTGQLPDNIIRVSATRKLLSDSLVCNFSNFGENKIELFAPGSAIYSTLPGNNYSIEEGTSIACPMVTGVAALLKSYFPSLTAKQTKEIIMESVYKPDIMVIPPSHAGFSNKILFSKLSKSGGIVNAYNAVKLANKMSKKSPNSKQL